MLNTGLCLSDPVWRLSQLMQDLHAGNKHTRLSSLKELSEGWIKIKMSVQREYPGY